MSFIIIIIIIITKAGQSVFGTLLDILSDIDYVSSKSNNETSKQILLNISCTMTDRAATQIKFTSCCNF